MHPRTSPPRTGADASGPSLTPQDDPKEQQKIDEALSHFALLAIRPVAVEVLELKPVPNKRTQWAEKGAEWIERRVAP